MKLPYLVMNTHLIFDLQYILYSVLIKQILHIMYQCFLSFFDIQGDEYERKAMKIFDKAQWHIDGGEISLSVTNKFVAIFEFLNEERFLILESIVVFH